MSMSMLGIVGIVLLVAVVVGTAAVLLVLRMFGAREVRDDHPNWAVGDPARTTTSTVTDQSPAP